MLDWEKPPPGDPCASAQVVLWDRRIAYAVTDRNLHVQQVRGTPKALQGDPGSWLGKSLLDLVPELLGSEDALQDILAGVLPRLEIPWVNRDGDEGKTTYLTLVDLPCRDITGAIVGVGSTQRASAVRWGVAGNIVWAWIFTIPASAFVAAIAYWISLKLY